MHRTLIQCINRIKIHRINSPLKRNHSSSSLQTIDNHSSKPPLSPLFNLLPPSQNPNNLVDLICSSLRTDQTHLSRLKNDAESILSQLGPTEVSRVLLRFQSDYSSALAFFNWVRTDLGLTPSTRNYCHVIHVLASSQQLTPAMKLLSDLIASVKPVSPRQDIFHSLVSCAENCNWSPVVFDMLIKGYIKKGMVREGFVTFSKSVEFGFIPSVVCCNFLLNGLARTNCVEQCWTVFDEMGRTGVYPNTHTFNILTHLLCKFGDANKANDFIEKMEEQGFEPDVVTYNILISSCCRKRRLEDAVYLYKIMYRRNVIPNLVTYTVLMKGFCWQGKVKEAHQIFHRMVHRGVHPDVVTYNTLIYGYCEEGKMKECRLLLHGMIQDGICPNNLTCSLLVRGYQKEGKLLSAYNLVVELERGGVHVSSDNYDFLMVALCRANHPFAAKSLWERISQDGHYTPGATFYKEMILSLCRCDYGSEALLVKDDMLRRNLKLNAGVYRDLVECVCRASKTAEGESLMKEMIGYGILPDSETCRALVCGYCREGDLERAESTLDYFAKEFGVCDTESYNALVKVFSEVGDATKLFDLQDRMQRAGFVPNSLTCKYVIHSLRKSK